MTIPNPQLVELEKTVAELMHSGRFMDAISLLRRTAKVHGMSSDQLAKRVADLALELGHVQPIRMTTEPVIEGEVLPVQ